MVSLPSAHRSGILTHKVGLYALLAIMSLIIAAIVAAALRSLPAYATTPTQPIGTVTQSRVMTLPAELQPLATGKQITYVSTDINGTKILVTGAIITPKNKQPGAKIVAWAHGTTGIGDNCAPSKNLNVFWPEAVSAVASYLQKGWVVAATDYQGLGTPGPHPYLIGKSEGRNVIDSVRAARYLDSSLSTNWVAAGHSQGGQAALFASQVNPGYGNGLSLKGVVPIAPASNVQYIMPGVIGTPANFYVVYALYGLAAVDPTVKPNELLAQPALDRVSVLETGCYDEAFAAFYDLTAEELLVGGQLPDSIVAKLAANMNPAQTPVYNPSLIVQGENDEVVPASITEILHEQVCKSYAGARSQYYRVQGADHIGSVVQSTGYVSQYIQNRFAGQTAPTNCFMF